MLRGFALWRSSRNFTLASRSPFYPNARAMYYGGIRDVSNLRVASRWHTENVAEELMGFPKFTSQKSVPPFSFLHVTVRRVAQPPSAWLPFVGK